MSISDILAIVGLSGSGSLCLILTIIQISKINLNPWTFIWTSLGNALTRGVMKEVKDLNNEMKNEIKFEMKGEIKRIEDKLENYKDELIQRDEDAKKENDFEELELVRHLIVTEADRIAIDGKDISRDHAIDIINLIKKYKQGCKKYPDFPNGKAILSVDILNNYICDKFHKCE